MHTILIPGRHLVTTRFQEEYLFQVVRPPFERLVWAVTSSNQANSRYNPIPFHVRAIALDRFNRQVAPVLGVRFSILGIPHHRPTDRFLEILLKEIHEQSMGELALDPSNTTVLVSTPQLAARWEEMGFPVLPAESRREEGPDGPRFVLQEVTPAEVVRRLGELGPAGLDDEWIRRELHPASFSVFRDFPEVLRTLHALYSDPLLKESGDLTETRDYDTYVRAMSRTVEHKYADVREFLLPGRIVDEGCADGTLLARIARDFPDSDLIGVDLSAEMLARARERQRAGEFSGCFVHFHQANLLKPLPFTVPVDTVLCNSTLHELYSFGEGEASLRAYLRLKRAQLRSGGRIVIRDVVGPEGRKEEVLLRCAGDRDGDAWRSPPPGDPQAWLDGLGTAQLFRRFAADFYPRRPRPFLPWSEAETPGGPGFRMPLQLAMEFVAKMTYTDNWASEMQEQFCFWEFDEWRAALEEAGFRVLEGSRAYVNAWRVANHFQGRVDLYSAEGRPLPWPSTNMVLAAERRE